MNMLCKMIAIGSFLTVPLSLQAQVILGLGSGGGTNTSAGATSTQGGLGGSSYVPAVAITPTVTTTDAMVTNAQKAADQQKKGKNTAMIVGGVMTAIAAGTCPACGTHGTCSICAASVVGAAASF